MGAFRSLAALRDSLRHTRSPTPAAASGATGPAASAHASRLRDLPRWLWLWFPLVSITVVFGVRLFFGEYTYKFRMGSEQGVVENTTVVILILAIVAGLLAFRRRRSLPSPWLGRGLLLLTAGCVYFAVEELSWGQQLFGWQTPALFNAINDQRKRTSTTSAVGSTRSRE